VLGDIEPGWCVTCGSQRPGDRQQCPRRVSEAQIQPEPGDREDHGENKSEQKRPESAAGTSIGSTACVASGCHGSVGSFCGLAGLKLQEDRARSNDSGSPGMF
jgi:hypothetical protein